MSRSQAIRSGASAVMRQPLVILAELAWRWSFSAAVILIGGYSLLLFLHSLPVSGGDMFGLSGIIPGLFGETLAHVFRGSGPKVLKLAAAMAVGFSTLWCLAASLGRAATLQCLIAGSSPGAYEISQRRRPNVLATIFGVNIFRVVLGFATLLSYIAAIFLAALISGLRAGAASPGNAAVAKFYFIFLPLAVLISAIGSMIGWYLSLAPILAVSQGSGILASIGAAAAVSRKRASQFAWVGFVGGGLRLVVYGGAFLVLLAIAGLSPQLPGAIVFGMLAVFALVYSAFSTVIFIVKLGAYARIVQWHEEQEKAPPPSEFMIVPPTAALGADLVIAQMEPPPTPAI